MTAHEPAHVFRIERYEELPVYIAADSMALGQDGVTRFWCKPEGALTSELVATIFPTPGQFIARVDVTLTEQTIKGVG